MYDRKLLYILSELHHKNRIKLFEFRIILYNLNIASSKSITLIKIKKIVEGIHVIIILSIISVEVSFIMINTSMEFTLHIQHRGTISILVTRNFDRTVYIYKRYGK